MKQPQIIRGKLEGLTASARFRCRGDFVTLWRLLRENQSFAGAAEQIDRIAAELLRVHGVELPVPTDLFQNGDCTLCLCWGEGDASLSLFCHRTTILWRAGGIGDPQVQQHPEVRGIPADLLNALVMRARMAA